MADSTPRLPEYRIRVSDRARRPRLQVTPHDGLVVVLPRGYPASKAPEIVARHAVWVERTLARTAEHRAHVADWRAAPFPERLELPGVGAAWSVELTPRAGASVRAHARDGVLELTGPIDDADAAYDALRRFVARAARERLPLALGGIEAETGWDATGVTVRRQKTRWGSCTAKRAVSLNESLCFLPPHLVRHVLVHELAHTRRLDHSPQFWALVEAHDARWREHRRELADAWRYVPGWALPERR